MISKEKREIIQVLESYSLLLAAEKNLTERIGTLKTEYEMSSGEPELYSNDDVEHLFLFTEYTERLTRIRQKIEWIERSLSVLPEEEERVLRNEFFDEKSIPAITENCGKGKSSIYRIRTRALSHFALGYDGTIV